MDIFYATILVLVVTKQHILLAADSRKTYLDKNGIQKLGTIDKIYKTNDSYYAVCGFHEEENEFSIHEIIHQHLVKNISIKEAIKQLVHSLASALKNYFTNLKKTSPSVFKQLKQISASGGEVFIVKCVDSIPSAFLIDYRIIDGATIKVTMNTWSIDTVSIKESDTCFWRAVGNTPLLTNSYLTEKEWALYPEENAKRLIEDGSKLYPNFVGGPINMVELSSNGVRWIEKSPTAPNSVGGA